MQPVTITTDQFEADVLDSSLPPMDTVAELDAAAFEDELRRGDDVVVVDVRSRADFSTWHVTPGRSEIVNVPEAELVADPDAALADVPPDARLRIICNAGNASRRAAAALEQRTRDVRSVTGGLIGWSRVLQHDEIPLSGRVSVVQFRREARGCLSYLLHTGTEALVVDPAPDVQPYLDEAARRGVRVTRVLDTHVHADHLSGARELARRTGATLHLSHAAILRGISYGAQVKAVRDGDTLSIGGEAVQVIALPGHTSDMIGLEIAEEALIGGDSLFADSVARPDLESGDDDGAADAARLLHHTLRDRVGALPDSMLLLPCHYAGGRLDAPLAPTLGAVRRRVSEIALDEDAFVMRVLDAMPPRPANYLAIIAVNLGAEPDDDAAAGLEIGANNCAASAAWADGGV